MAPTGRTGERAMARNESRSFMLRRRVAKSCDDDGGRVDVPSSRGRERGRGRGRGCGAGWGCAPGWCAAPSTWERGVGAGGERREAGRVLEPQVLQVLPLLVVLSLQSLLPPTLLMMDEVAELHDAHTRGGGVL